MQEWDVVGVLAALAALFGLVIAPIVKLTQAITRLTATRVQVSAFNDIQKVRNKWKATNLKNSNHRKITSWKRKASKIQHRNEMAIKQLRCIIRFGRL